MAIPEVMITGRKNSALAKVLPLNFWFSTMAINRLKITQIGTSITNLLSPGHTVLSKK